MLSGFLLLLQVRELLVNVFSVFGHFEHAHVLPHRGQHGTHCWRLSFVSDQLRIAVDLLIGLGLVVQVPE